MLHGYARVSTDGQSLDAQLAALRAAGCGKIWQEKASGAKTDRAQLHRAIAALEAEDVLIVTKLDRLARSTRDLLNTLHRIDEAGARFRVLDQPLIDTTTPFGKILTVFVALLAEMERGFIQSRTSEGRKRAISKGVKMGPKFKLSAHQTQEARRLLDADTPGVEIARLFNVDPATISRLKKRGQHKGP